MKAVIYLFTFLIIFFGFSFKFFSMPIDTAIFELLNPQKYIDLVLGG
jgi:multicomponent Na+:H+ antiporter subunit D